MSQAQDMIAAALAQEPTARHYADLILICDSSLPEVHAITASLRETGRTWAEFDGRIFLRIQRKSGGVVWDGRDYKQLRQARYTAMLAQPGIQELLMELEGEERSGFMESLRAGIRAEFPNPEEVSE